MAKKQRKSFVMYFDWMDIFEMLSKEQCGALIMALLKYARYGIADENMPLELNVAFTIMRQAIDRDTQSYEDKCTRNAENGKKGGRPTSKKEEQSIPEEPKEVQNEAESVDVDVMYVLDEESRERLISKGVDSEYIAERKERAEAYAAEKCMTAYDVLFHWWISDRSQVHRSAGANGASPRDKPMSEKDRQMEEWFERRIRNTFGD